MINAVREVDIVRHAGFAPGAFPARWHDAAYALHCCAWTHPWEGRLSRDRFMAELDSGHVDVLYAGNGNGAGGELSVAPGASSASRFTRDASRTLAGKLPVAPGELLAYVKWKATEKFHLSRDRLSDPGLPSLPGAPPAGYVCAYEITASADRSWRGLGRRLLTEAMKRWERDHGEAVFCTYSPKRKLTAVIRRLAESEQYDRPALEAFAHRAGAAASRHIDDWVARLGQPLESFIRREIVPVSDERITQHLAALSGRFGKEVIDGVVAAIGLAYNFVLCARSGEPACGPAAFHRALGAEHWRQYPASATNCADALGLVDHWRYSHDPARREKCAKLFKTQRTAHAQRNASTDQLLVLA